MFISAPYFLQAFEDAKLAGALPSGGGGKKSKQSSTVPADKIPHAWVSRYIASFKPSLFNLYLGWCGHT